MLEINKIYQGNALTVLKTFPDKFFYTCATSPPYYGLRSYGTEPQIWDGKEGCKHKWGGDILTNNSGGGWFDPEKRGQYENQRLKNPKKEKQNQVSQGCFCLKCGAWRGELGLEPSYKLFLDHLIQIFREVKRVLRDDGTLFVNLGDSYSGSGSPGGDYKNKRKGDEYLRKYNRNEMAAKTQMQLPSRFAIAMTDELGFLLRNRIIWEKNVMPTSAKDRFTHNYEDIFFFSKQEKYYFEQQLEPANYDGRKDTKFKGSQKYNNPNYTPDGNVNTFAKEGYERWTEINGIKMRNKRSIWKVSSEALDEEHFATYPQKLIEPIIKAGCPEEICSVCNAPVLKVYESKGGGVGKSMHNHEADKEKGNRCTNKDAKGGSGYHRVEDKIICRCNAEFHPGVVLDPFIGSGTTGIVARKLNRNFVGIDLKYHGISNHRLEKELGLFR